MKIAFFASYAALEYSRIGGTESFARRLSSAVVDLGVDVDWVVYNAPLTSMEAVRPGFRVLYVKTLSEALRLLSSGYRHVTALYVEALDRTKWAFFRYTNRLHIKFHFVYFNWPDSWLKRKAYFYEARISPYNGKLICISKRQYDYVGKHNKNVVHILPPVPEDYFLPPANKLMGERIRLTFLGRIDAGKGIDEAIRIFEALRDSPKYECCIYGIRCERESQSRVIHEQLAKQRMIKYVAVDRNRYSLETEQFVRDVLADTDVFIQPYQRLSSTIDTPLLLLESMASLCAVLTKPYGNIPDIYGESDFLLSPVNFVQSAVGLLQNTLVENIQREHLRVFAQIQKYSFNSSVVAKQYLAAINL